MKQPDKLILVGVISSAHGIKGEVMIRSLTANPRTVIALPLVNQTDAKIELKFIRQNPKGDLICKVNNIDNRNDAESLKGTELFCLRSDMPDPAEEEFYIEDLKDLTVVGLDLAPVGRISGIFNFGAGDIIEICFTDNKTELFPFRKEIFPEITKGYVIFIAPAC